MSQHYDPSLSNKNINRRIFLCKDAENQVPTDKIPDLTSVEGTSLSLFYA